MKVAGCPVIGHATVPTPTRRNRPPPPPVPNRDKIILTGHGLTNARVNRQAEFVIDATDASPGKYYLLHYYFYCYYLRPGSSTGVGPTQNVLDYFFVKFWVVPVL